MSVKDTEIFYLQLEIVELKTALKNATMQTARVSKKLVNFDPAGSDYEVDWLPEVRGWAELCGLDLTKHDPFFYLSR